MEHIVIGTEGDRPVKACDSMLIVTTHAVDHSKNAPGEGGAWIEAHSFLAVDAPLNVVADRTKQCEAIDRMGESICAILLDGAARQDEGFDQRFRQSRRPQ